jgi:Cap4-like dsDNA endonuclease family protein
MRSTEANTPLIPPLFSFHHHQRWYVRRNFALAGRENLPGIKHVWNARAFTMTTAQELPETKRWPSIDHARPSEQGGSIARIGFTYQDEVAVGFLIDMLSDPLILKIHCETHDDIVVVRTADSLAIAEFVQVKGAELDKLWSVADLCRRENGPGTSILPTSSRQEISTRLFCNSLAWRNVFSPTITGN